MDKTAVDRVITVLLIPVYMVYGLLYLISFPVEKLLEVMRIDLGIRNEIKNIFRSDNIRRYYVYAFFRMINVAILFYFIYTVQHTSFLDFSELREMSIVLLICVAGIFLLHFMKRFIFRRMGITPFREVNAKDMDGVKFEHYCAELLRANGYKNVRITKASGDQGVDIVAELKKEKYAVQCKYYSTPIGNKPVQEVYAGKTFYECDRAIVMTNSRFTKGAMELAESVDVKLWPMIPIMDTGRGLIYYWYVIDIILMTVVYVAVIENIDNLVGILLVGAASLYVLLFILIFVDFLTVKDLAYYKKNEEYLNETELAEYRARLEQYAAGTDEYENIAYSTEDLEEFIYAMEKIEDIYKELEVHDKNGVIPDSVEDRMDSFYQNKHMMEIGFIDRTYDRTPNGKLLIPEYDYERMTGFTDEAKEYIEEYIYEYI